MRGPHGIPVDTFRSQAVAASALDGVIKTTDDDAPWHEYGY
jgi:hypothetical protein